ncbi:gliding motility-associated ABC transporter substrate-binding protein GldG [Nonlabens agnitus]|uniref:Gliding motility-associated ABC transporter substrate-binding protein GldG n=1 Tax=Nonlabens agnitus TaxID=870484 RepID=A0A2S9WSJ9_9FLAO|nr:gliding motility-associated ABC transporter substrate-binding protein GldG [Nonlabens agnitus]PRP66419.1 gliding motility-associated ABC transporter substrate-binding protein GldG [Nonlabens agnitus]
MIKIVRNIALLIVALVAINYLSGKFHKRFDLTENQRYTIAPETKKLLDEAELPIFIDVFLDGELPSEFLKLKQETRQLLEELAAIHPNVKYDFLDPVENLNPEEANQVVQQLAREGVQPAVANIIEKGKQTNVTVFPYAIIAYDGKRTAIPLLKSVARSTTEQRVNSSINQLEYQLADGLRKVSKPKDKTIAILRDSGELSNLQIADFIRSLQAYYRIAPFGIEFVTSSDSVTPVKVLNELKKYDLVVEPKPTVAFSETKKYVLDQYVMNGGNLLMAVDPIIMENDSLANPDQKAYALSRDLNLDDMLFRYGLRLNRGLIKDVQSGALALATGQGRNTQYEAFQWPYYPMASGDSTSDITRNLEEVKFEYTGSLDTLKSSSKKQILLSSSAETAIVTLPSAISLNELDDEIDPQLYRSGSQPLAAIAQGSFISAYKNRVKPFEIKDHKDETSEASIFLAADGDIMKNQIDRGQPQDLGYDMRTGQFYGNKEFLMNVVNYMLDDDNLIALRNKEIKVPFLDIKRSYDHRLLWQTINIVVPLLIILGFGGLFLWLRKRKYTS